MFTQCVSFKLSTLRASPPRCLKLCSILMFETEAASSVHLYVTTLLYTDIQYFLYV